nr:hypothetical protein Iba_chr03aCG3120 [Ipomoea batatas]
MTSENNCIIEDVDNEVNFFNPYDFNDSDSFDSSDDDENCFDNCENNSFNSTENDAIQSCEENFSNYYDSNSSNPHVNNSFVSLDDNDGLESFTFDDNALSNENVDDLHGMFFYDDMNVDASLCDLNDIECVNFLDDCLDDAMYIHDMLGEVEEETDGCEWDVLLSSEKEEEKENMLMEKESVEGKEKIEKEERENEKQEIMVEGVENENAKEEVEDKKKTRDESVREEVEEKVRNDEKEFDASKDKEQRNGQKEPSGRAIRKAVSGGFYFDFPLLDSYGCREEVERLTSQPFWDHLFSWRDDTYVLVVYEFIATFASTEENHHSIPSVKFTVFGQEHHLSIDQLGTHLRFYTQDHMHEEEYRNLPNDFDSDAAVEEYWHKITGGNAGRFIGAKPNTSKIRSPALKALKFLLGLTFGGRHKNLHKVYQTDLFRLWSLAMNQPIQMACIVKQWLQTQARDKCPYVWIGPIVS